MRRVLPLLAAVATAVAVVASATPAHAGPGESRFTSLANSARGRAGLRGYVVATDLVAVARRQAARMAAKGDIWHNPNLTREVSNWRAVGENVGMGGTVDVIHQALMDSPTHRSNILDRDFTEVGMGTATDAKGTIYVAQVFRQPLRARATAAPKPKPRPVATRPAATPRRVTTRPSVAPARPAAARPARPAVPAATPPDPRAILASRLAAAHAAADGASATGSIGRGLRYVTVLHTLG